MPSRKMRTDKHGVYAFFKLRKPLKLNISNKFKLHILIPKAKNFRSVILVTSLLIDNVRGTEEVFPSTMTAQLL
jgi:hypothetical protein